MNPLDAVLARLTNIQENNGGYTARCSAHDDQHNSLSVSTGEDRRVLLKCHAGCPPEDIMESLGLHMADLFSSKSHRNGRGGEGSGIPRGTPAHLHNSSSDDLNSCNLERYSEAKKLPLAFLQGLGLTEFSMGGRPAVRMPYYGPDKQEAAVRFRTALQKGEQEDNRFQWRKGARPCPYGLWRLEDARRAERITLCEGESDTQTLWCHDEPALGIPGAASWREEYSALLADIPRVYVVVEPDKGGQTFQAALAKSSLRDRIYLIRLGEAKDPSGLYLQDPLAFRMTWRATLDSAVPLASVLEAEREAVANAAWQRSKDLAAVPDILASFAQNLEAHGVVGEVRVGKLLYLVLTSRLLGRPVSVAVKGPSSAGKSFLVEQVLARFPGQAYYALSAMSERALAYSQEPLAHRHLVIYEAAGISGDFGSYLMRSLLSEGHVRYETVEKTREGMRPRLIERDGPTGLIVTTTAPRLHPENETRLLSIPVTDTREQTHAVLRALAGDRQVAPSQFSLDTWQALQEWLGAAGGTSVDIPYGGVLADLVPAVAVRLRRDFAQVLTLIRAHTLLHQVSRPRDAAGRIVATHADYRAVYDLLADLVADGVEATVSQTVRDTVQAVEAICRESQTATVAQVARRLKIDRSAAQRRVADCLSKGYLQAPDAGRGRALQISIGEPLPEEQEILPAPDRLAEEMCRCAGVQGGIATPTPPPAAITRECPNCGTALFADRSCPFCDGNRLEYEEVA